MSYIKCFINFNIILRIIYVVNINAFLTLVVFKCICCPLKLVVVLFLFSSNKQIFKMNPQRHITLSIY